MQGAGGAGSIARLLFEAGPRPRSTLRSGEIVRAQVIKQLAPSKWMLGIAGRAIPAYSERALSAGMIFRAQVRVDGGTVFLQPYQEVGGQEGALRFLAAEGLPRDDLSVTILRALLRSGMPLDPGRIRGAYAFFRNREQVSSRTVRAYLLMQDKGLEPSAEGLDRFIEAADGFSGRGHGGHGEGGARGGRGDDRRRERRGGTREGDSPEDTVRELVTRRQEEPDDLIHAFNHLRSDRGHWILVPFAVDAGEGAEEEATAYRGSIRIHFAGEQPRFDRAVVSVEGAAGRWELELARSAAGEAGRGGVRLFTPDGSQPPASLLGDLRERLASLGLGPVSLDSGENFDGFSTDESLDILKGIDTEA
jgi:hypothetical protein